MNAQDKERYLRLDRQAVWHPFTQMKDYETLDHVLIERAEGVFLYDADGNRYYDTISSWWVNVHGHRHPRIVRAIVDLLERMDHIQFSGLTHPAAIDLAAELLAIAPPGLTKVFYSDDGSTAVEVALKMSFQYWRHIGRPEKTVFVCLENGYHGDTIGAVSVGGVDQFHAAFRPLLFETIRVPSPNPWKTPDPSPDAVAKAARATVDAVADVLERSADRIAGLIFEPMVQAAGGMIVYPADVVRALRELTTCHGVHLIADEIAVGFGRTGRMWGVDHAAISPDLMCVSKGLTAGVLPLAVTLATEEIYRAFYDDYETMKTFFHGHSFTANPIAAAAALENVRMFREEPVLERARATADALSTALDRLRRRPHVASVRHLGMIAAFDLYRDKSTGERFDFRERAGFRVYLEGLKEGLILRPLGDTLYYWLPLCTTPEQAEDIVLRTERTLDRLGL